MAVAVADAPTPRAQPRKITYVRPRLYRKQRLAIFDGRDVNGEPARYSFVEASTKAGKTVGAMAWLAEQALITGREGRNYWWVAPVYNQAKIAFGRMKRGLPRGFYFANNSDLWLRLLNGAVISFKTAEKPDNLYGEDVFAAVVDEASRCREESWHAVRTTVTATRGPVRCIGNVKGGKNWFFKLCRQAEAGHPGFSYAKITAYDAVAAGVLDAQEIADAKAMLPDHVFRELYLAEPSDDGGNPFGLQHIRACTVPSLSDGLPFAAGVDLAKSVDWTVVVALDQAAAVCGFERWQKTPWGATQKRILHLVGNTPTLVDSTGVGDPIFEALQRKRPGSMEGFKFNATNKQQLMEGLAVAIQNHVVNFPADSPIRAELETFEYKMTRTGVRYSAPEGYHDDCVVALALAIEKRRRRMPEFLHGAPDGITRVSPWIGQGSVADEDEGEDDYGDA